MRRPQRLIAAAVLVALSGALAGCGGGGLGNFDPSDMLDFLDTKKKLPGERKPVFPDGVPGLDQGVPKDLYKGARQQQLDDPNAQAATAAPPPVEEPRSKRGAKGKQAAAAPGATFRHSARELLALSAWRANDTSAARQWLDMIANDGQTPPSMRSRAEALQALLPPVAKS